MRKLFRLLAFFTAMASFLPVLSMPQAAQAAAPLISCGSETSFAMKIDGTIWGWGENNNYQLGDGTATDRYKPVKVDQITRAKAITGGDMFSVALKPDGTVWTWGQDIYNWGVLGTGKTISASPEKISDISDITAISSSGSHALAVKSDGTVWAWGYNGYGQLGSGNYNNSPIPTQVQGLTDVVAVAAGSGFSIALKSDGTVWAWGANMYGQLGDGTTNLKALPVQVKNLSGVQAIGSGVGHSLALKNDGTIWAWGQNNYGQLGDGTYTNRTSPIFVLSGVTEIIVGGEHNFARMNDGTYYGWGHNNYQQLAGDRTYTNKTRPALINSLYYTTAVAAGRYHTLALKIDGTVWAWGCNYNGQCGQGYVSRDCEMRTVVNLNQVPVYIESIQVNPSSLELETGQSAQLTVTAVKSNGSTEDVTLSAAYQTDNSNLATVSDSGMITAIETGYTNITVTFDGLTLTVPVTVTGRQLDSIIVNPEVIQIPAGLTQQLTVIAVFSDGTTEDVTEDALSQLDGPITISSGVIQGVSEGEGTITVTYRDKTAVVLVTVMPPVPLGLTVEPGSMQIPAGLSEQLVVMAEMSDGTTTDVTEQANFHVKDMSIGTISNTGLFTAVKEGVTTVVVTYQGITTTVEITVVPPVITELIPLADGSPLGPDDHIVLIISHHKQLGVQARMSDGTVKDVTAEAMFSSGNPEVASVNADGLVEGISEGTAEITITVGNKEATVSVDVTPVAAIYASKSHKKPHVPSHDKIETITVPAEKTKKIYVTAELWDGTLMLVEVASFEVEDPDVASVDSNGMVTGIASGTTEVLISYKHAASAIIVRVPPGN